MDCMFMGEETGGKTLAVLVAKHRSSSSLHEGAGVRDEHGDIEDRQRNGAGGGGCCCGESAGEPRRPADYHGESSSISFQE